MRNPVTDDAIPILAKRYGTIERNIVLAPHIAEMATAIRNVVTKPPTIPSIFFVNTTKKSATVAVKNITDAVYISLSKYFLSIFDAINVPNIVIVGIIIDIVAEYESLRAYVLTIYVGTQFAKLEALLFV